MSKYFKNAINHWRYMSKNKPFSMYYFLGWNRIRNKASRLKCLILGHEKMHLPTKSMIEPIVMNGDNYQVVCIRCGMDLYFIREGEVFPIKEVNNE